VEVGFRNTVSAQVPLGLVPEVFDAVDMVGAVGKGILVVDALVVEFGNIEDIARPTAIRVDNAVGLAARTDNADQGLPPGVRGSWPCRLCHRV